MVRRLAPLLAIVCLLAFAEGAKSADCTPEPASQWAPAGFVCPPAFGIGTASTYGGPGAARNDCTFPFQDCAILAVKSLDTGRIIQVRPITWCMCWVGVTGPNGETARIIDLDPEQVRALGLDPSRGLWQVEVQPSEGLPDTAMTERTLVLMAAGVTVLLVLLLIYVSRRR